MQATATERFVAWSWNRVGAGGAECGGANNPTPIIKAGCFCIWGRAWRLGAIAASVCAGADVLSPRLDMVQTDGSKPKNPRMTPGGRGTPRKLKGGTGRRGGANPPAPTIGGRGPDWMSEAARKEIDERAAAAVEAAVLKTLRELREQAAGALTTKQISAAVRASGTAAGRKHVNQVLHRMHRMGKVCRLPAVEGSQAPRWQLPSTDDADGDSDGESGEQCVVDSSSYVALSPSAPVRPAPGGGRPLALATAASPPRGACLTTSAALIAYCRDSEPTGTNPTTTTMDAQRALTSSVNGAAGAGSTGSDLAKLAKSKEAARHKKPDAMPVDSGSDDSDDESPVPAAPPTKSSMKQREKKLKGQIVAFLRDSATPQQAKDQLIIFLAQTEVPQANAAPLQPTKEEARAKYTAEQNKSEAVAAWRLSDAGVAAQTTLSFLDLDEAAIKITLDRQYQTVVNMAFEKKWAAGGFNRNPTQSPAKRLKQRKRKTTTSRSNARMSFVSASVFPRESFTKTPFIIRGMKGKAFPTKEALDYGWDCERWDKVAAAYGAWRKETPVANGISDYLKANPLPDHDELVAKYKDFYEKGKVYAAADAKAAAAAVSEKRSADGKSKADKPPAKRLKAEPAKPPQLQLQTELPDVSLVAEEATAAPIRTPAAAAAAAAAELASVDYDSDAPVELNP